MKTREHNDLINRTGEFYVKNDTKLSWLIKQGGVYDEN